MRDASATKTTRPTSLWLDQAITQNDTYCPPLSGHEKADVAIVGGGYVGLWTAIELKEREPTLDVVILEQDVCGSGASGRNGGYVLSWWPRAASLISAWGADTAADIIGKTEAAIGELEEFCIKEKIAAEFTRCGWVWGATSEHQVGGWSPAVEACEKLGVGAFSDLGSDEVAASAGTGTFQSAIFDQTAALLHPGHLVRGMREVALRRGVRIFEHTDVKHFSRSRPVTLTTTNGTVLADTLVLATNAWAARVPELARSIVVVSSDIIASRPIPGRLKTQKWASGPGVNDSRQMVNYVRTTFDGRILSGKGGLASGYGGRISDSLFHNKKRAAVVRQNFDALYPSYCDVDTPISWSGPVDRSADGLPMLGALPNHDNILFGIGWSGNGLGPSRMGGRILSSLALGESNEWTTLPIVGLPKQDLPPEPIRYFGSHIVRAAVSRKDDAEANNKVPSGLVEAIAGLAPRGVEDQ